MDGLAYDDLVSDEDQKSWSWFCRLAHQESDSKTSRSVKGGEKTCHYVRLGRLARQAIRTKSRTTANHVLLFNVTMQPNSLWLAYDFAWFDDELNVQRRPLGDTKNDSDYDADLWYHCRKGLPLSIKDHNLLCKSRDADADGKGYLGVREPFDLAMMSEDIRADWKNRALLDSDRGEVRACMDLN